jgi:uncharacterized protein (TIGR04222 family)
MWPFDLRGPEFLVFYLIVCTLVALAAYLLRHAGEPADTTTVNLSDPYLIAFLRGGKNEVLRVVTMSLVDRGLLSAAGTKIAAAEGAFGNARSELEQKIVRHFNPSAEATSLFKTTEAEPEMRGYERQLTQLGLLPDAEQKQARLLRMTVALAVVLGLAIVKLYVALTTGHSNVQFLIFLAALFAFLVIRISRPRLSLAGERVVADLRTLCAGLKERSQHIQNGASPAEFALMAAVFGIAAIPTGKKLFPRAGGSGCGSSCGSSSSCGGSSCGGGGCGGCGS